MMKGLPVVIASKPIQARYAMDVAIRNKKNSGIVYSHCENNNADLNAAIKLAKKFESLWLYTFRLDYIRATHSQLMMKFLGR